MKISNAFFAGSPTKWSFSVICKSKSPENKNKTFCYATNITQTRQPLPKCAGKVIVFGLSLCNFRFSIKPLAIGKRNLNSTFRKKYFPIILTFGFSLSTSHELYRFFS